MSDRYQANPIESAATIAAEQEAKMLDNLGVMYKHTKPVGRVRVNEREQVMRWLSASPEQRTQAQAQWGPEKYQEWNTTMFQRFLKYKKS